jgi:2-dehydropantoate 2-reductase
MATALGPHAEVHVYARGSRGAHAIAEGLTLTGLSKHHLPPGLVNVHLSDIEPFPSRGLDVLLLSVKSYQVASVIDEVLPCLSSEGVVAYLGNGLGVVEALERRLPGQVVALTCTHGAMVGSGASTTWTGQGSILLGTWPSGPVTAPIEELETLLMNANLNPICIRDASARVWRKALLNIAINPICALAGVENGVMLERTDLLESGLELMREAMAVGQALGRDQPSPTEAATDVIDVLTATSANRCSMLEDVTRGRRTEIDALNGAVVDLGERAGVPTPRNAQITALLRAIDADHTRSAL